MTSVILGPPGTGKTTAILNLIEGELNNGTAPDKIGYFAFTKKASEEGKTYFRLKDLIDYFTRQQFRDYGRNHIAARLREQGGGHHFFHVKGKGITVWFVPEFNAQAEGFDLPEMNEEPF